MKYNFNETIDRTGTHALKYDVRKPLFGTEDVLPMWVADMDLASPSFVREAIIKRAEHPIYGYSLRSDAWHQSVINWMYKRHHFKISKKEMAFCPGVVPALAVITLALTQPGDKIILQSPSYPPFYATIKDNGRQIIDNQLKEGVNGYEMDLEDLEAQIDNRTKMIMLCNPHNPTGRVWTKEELKKLGDICVKRHIIIVSDEIHSDLIMPGFKHVPMASISPEIAQQTITTIAPSKTFNLAGLSSAVVFSSNTQMLDTFNHKMHDIHLFVGNVFGNVALEAAYTHGEEWLEQLLVHIQANIDYLHNFFTEKLPKIKFTKPEATYLIWLNFRAFGLSQKELKQKIIHEAKLGLNDGISFGDTNTGFMRINLACPRSHVEEAAKRLLVAFGDL